jgi:hypothetical protein
MKPRLTTSPPAVSVKLGVGCKACFHASPQLPHPGGGIASQQVDLGVFDFFFRGGASYCPRPRLSELKCTLSPVGQTGLL